VDPPLTFVSDIVIGTLGRLNIFAHWRCGLGMRAYGSAHPKVLMQLSNIYGFYGRPLETTEVMTANTFSLNSRRSDTGKGLGLDEARIQELGAASYILCSHLMRMLPLNRVLTAMSGSTCMQDVIIDRPLETTGVMTVTTFSPNPRLLDTGEGLGLDAARIQELGTSDIGENDLKVRLLAVSIPLRAVDTLRTTFWSVGQAPLRELGTADCWENDMRVDNTRHVWACSELICCSQDFKLSQLSGTSKACIM
jgi:hypothetical protein